MLPFGSFYTELYLPTSDIDLVCTNGASSNASGLRKIAKGLIAHNLVQKGSLKVITKARVRKAVIVGPNRQVYGTPDQLYC